MYRDQSSRTINETAEKKTQYEKTIKAAAWAFLEEKNYTKAYSAYSEALRLANELHMGSMQACILKFMICHCTVLESNKLDELAEVVMTLQNINKTLKERFPAIYCLLAHAHCKLYRFDYALESLRIADGIFKRNRLLETFYIPGTATPIEHSKQGTMWSTVEKECANWQKPDAICASKECNHITRPYTSPNKNIYISDPAFSGMVIVHCDNKTQTCMLKFHPACWKVIKDQTNLTQKVSDKAMLDVECFTPNCKNDNVNCRISFIEVIGTNGEVKAQMQKSTTDSWLVNKTVSNGAIKKQKAVYTKTAENPKSTPQKEHVPVTPKNQFKVKKKVDFRDGFDENQLLTVINSSPNFDATDNSPVAGEKAFLFSLFYHYIRDNYVRVCDLYTKFSEINDSLNFLKDIDILTFLLDTNVIVAMDDKDVGDMLDDLINADDDDFPDTTGNHKNNNDDNVLGEQFLLNTCNGINYKDEGNAAGGDASLHYSSVNTAIDVKEKVTENKKLQQYVITLKKEMQDLVEENLRLKKETQEKDYKIEVFLKQMDECEALYEKMTDFKKRYDEVKDENFKLKKEIIVLINEKKLMEEQIVKLNDSEARRKEMKQTFQEEYKILQNCINTAWEKKTEELKESLKQESEAKKSWLSQYLRTQFNANKNVLNRYIDQCTITLDVIGKLNTWVEKFMNVKNFKDNTEWMDRLNRLQKASAELQNDFTNLFDKLHTEECPAEVSLECPTVPDAPNESLGDIVMNVFNFYYTSQYELVKNLMQKQQQQQQQINQQWQAQQLQAQQLQRSASYNMQVYPYVAVQQPALAFATSVHPHVAYRQAPRLNNIQPSVVQQLPTAQNRIGVPITKSNIEIKELNSSNENLSVNSATSSLGKLDIQDKKIKEESTTETNEPINTELKDEVKMTAEEPFEIYFNKLSERREQMRKALKAIALNVKEKTETDIEMEEESKKYANGDSAVTVDNKIEGDNNGLQLEICDDKSDFTSVISKGDSPKSKKKAGINSLIKVMQKKYPGALEVDIIEIIAEIRKKNNGTLTGKPVHEILNESEEYFLRNQRIHVMHYYLNDENKSSCSESSNNLPGSAQSSSCKDRISPTSDISEKFMNGTDTSSVQKKTWNTLPQEEVKWTVSGEIECSICMNIVTRRNCYALNCRHSFHTECIKKWLQSDRSCPNCRVVVTEDDEFPPLPA